MEDDRVRIAIYVLRRAVLQMPSSEALRMLRGMKLDKVTVAKEVIRLVGELKTPEAHRELLLWSRRDLHRDVRVALLRGLWDHLDDEATWPILEEAAASPDPAIASGVARIPDERTSALVQRRLVGLMALLLRHIDPKVRCDALARCEVMPVSDPEQRLAPHLLASLESPLPDEVSAAAAAVFATYAGRQASAVGETARRLTGNFRSLHCFLGELLARLGWDRSHLRATVAAVLAGLDDAPLTITSRVSVAARGLDMPELLAYLTNRVDQLHANALGWAANEVRDGRYTLSDLAMLEAAFCIHPEERIRRIGLGALLGMAARPTGWTAECRAKLAAYCNDPSVLVAEAAWFTFPPELPTAS